MAAIKCDSYSYDLTDFPYSSFWLYYQCLAAYNHPLEFFFSCSLVMRCMKAAILACIKLSWLLAAVILEVDK